MIPLAPITPWISELTIGDLLEFAARLTAMALAGHVALLLLRRAPAAARHLAASATLAALLAFPLALAVLPGWPVLRLPATSAIAALQGRASEPLHEIEGPDAQALPGTVAAEPPFAASDDASAAAGPGAPAWPAAAPLGAAGTAAAVAIAVAMLMVLARLASSAFAGWMAWRSASVTREDLLAEVREAAQRLGLGHAVPLRHSARIAVPVVVGMVRPVLLLPEAALDWPVTRLRAVLLHELAHVARRDGLALAVARAATALYWFHPLAWSLARAARHECERACDDAVLRSGVRASDYAEHLLEVARGMSPAPLLGATLAFARPSSLEGRLIAILRPDARRAGTSRGAVALAAFAACLLLGPLTSLRVVAEPREPAPVPSTTIDAKQAVVRDDSRSGEEWYAEGGEAYQAAEYERSGEAYERAAHDGFQECKAWYNAACSWSLAGKRNRALGALQATLECGWPDPDQIQSDDDFAGLRSDGRFRMMLQAALQSGGSGKKREASKSRFQSLEDEDSRDASAWRSAGITLLRSGDYARSARAFERQAALDSSASALYNLACAQALGRRTSAAIATLERAVLAGFGDRDKLESDADLASLRSHPQFDRLARLADDLALFSNGRGDDDTEAWKRDLPRFRRVASEHPQLGLAWFNLGFAELRSDHFDASEAAFRRALGLGHRRGTTSYNLACVAARRGEIEAAFGWLDRAGHAGMKVAGIAANDGDLEALRGDARFREMTAQWKRESRAAKDLGKDKGKDVGKDAGKGYGRESGKNR